MGMKQNVASKNEDDQPSGYCAHGVETFPTWHRPYLAMLEVCVLPPGQRPELIRLAIDLLENGRHCQAL